MAATFVPVGQPAHDAERQALRFLVEGLPAGYLVYGNPWLVDRTGVIYELDAVVLGPHAIYVVEIKSYRGRIEGNDYDWYTPELIRSPLSLNRKTAQVLHNLLKRENFAAGQVWVEGLVFLSATTEVAVEGPASRDRLHTRETILAALQDRKLAERTSRRAVLSPTDTTAQAELHRILTQPIGQQPARHVREYEILAGLEGREGYAEYLARNGLSGSERILRVYSIPWDATEAERERIEKRALWEAQILKRLGQCKHILEADAPFSDDGRIVLPFHRFTGISLLSWLDRHGPALSRSSRNLDARVGLWLKIVEAVREAHEQGVVHRLLRPDVVLVEDKSEEPDVRITGFDLAKQLRADTTIVVTSVSDERMRLAAPEVVQAFSNAEPASDQFSLGALLGWILADRPLFDSTRELLANGRLVSRVREFYPRVPQSLDEAVARMLKLRSTDRFPNLQEAEAAVLKACDRQARSPVPVLLPPTERPDPENLAPGFRIEPDYQVIERLGQGGMAVVYAARHLVSGRMRVLKVASATDAAEDALCGEYDVLSKLNHPNIVRVVGDPSKMLAGRLTLVMERVSGNSLRKWLADPLNARSDLNTLRKYAEDLLAGLEALEQAGIVHKDLKPDNLMVGDGHLVVIDFSLAALPAEEIHCGTALYRDPAITRWNHGTDRYAAALCLFEVYTGRHAFDGRVPGPGDLPALREEDIEPAGLVGFFRKALHPEADQRFTSARAMREGFLAALGEEVYPDDETPAVTALDSTTDLRLTPLSRRAVGQLRRAGNSTVGELLALSEAQIRAIHAVGTRTANEILAFQDELRRQGVAAAPSRLRAEPAIHDHLASCLDPVEALGLAASIRNALRAAGFPTVGQVASASRSDLLAAQGIGRPRLVQILEALQRFKASATDVPGATSLDQLWERTSRPLSELQAQVVDRFIGVTRDAEIQGDIAADIELDQSRVSRLGSEGIERLDLPVLFEPVAALEALLDAWGGLATLKAAAERIEEQWPAGSVSGEGLTRLVIRIAGDRLVSFDADGADGPVLARPRFDRAAVRRFLEHAHRLASTWPPLEADSARRTLQAVLPEYDGDPLQLAFRLCIDIQVMEGGEIFVPPLDPADSLKWIIEHERPAVERDRAADNERLAISLDRLELRMVEVFGEFAPLPEREHLVEALGRAGYQVQGNEVQPAEMRSVVPPGRLEDPLPEALLAERPPEELLRDLLLDAAGSRGFRMVVCPPERHTEIGRSVATALDGKWLSFEDRWFTRHEAEVDRMERAERFAAQRGILRDSAEKLVFDLLDEFGRPGEILVLGDTAIWGRCGALDLVRRLYDETLSGSRGFWVLVVPGLIHDKQPHFNERTPIWHLDGITWPLSEPMRPPVATQAKK